jgi:hypothetical protein
MTKRTTQAQAKTRSQKEEHDAARPTQRQEALALIEQIPWGDMDEAIRDVEETLDRALAATAGKFSLWEAEGEDRYADEFSLTGEDVAERAWNGDWPTSDSSCELWLCGTAFRLGSSPRTGYRRTLSTGVRGLLFANTGTEALSQ